MTKLLKNKKALSPVVAAIILIAVTVAVSIAVAAWMGSMTFGFMETEQLTITSIVFTKNDDPINDTITVNLLNTGTTDVTISSATVTGVNVTTVSMTQTPIGKGVSDSFNITLTGTSELNTGSAYIVELLSLKGNKFAYTDTA